MSLKMMATETKCKNANVDDLAMMNTTENICKL